MHSTTVTMTSNTSCIGFQLLLVQLVMKV